MTSIFVAKLDFGVTSEELKSAFEQYGRVLKATVATDRETGKSRGFGFVEMADEKEANDAIQGLDNFKFNGRPVTVKLADQKERKPSNNQRDNRDFTPRNNNRPNNFNKSNHSNDRKPFNQERPESRVENTPTPTFIDPEEITKIVSKSDKTKKENKEIDREKEGKKKKGGMKAYKKSGKSPRFDDFMEDEDEDYLDWKKSSRNQFDEDEDDEDDNW